jgi:hypothetical protein
MSDFAEIQSIQDFPSLIKYLRKDLGWPVDEEQVDNLTFEYTPQELGLEAQAAVKIREIKQLRPLTGNQPWGIFWIDFEPKRLPVVVMRRILGALVRKQRGGRTNQATWKLDDLMFISATGEPQADAREIVFAHFHQEQGDLPTMRVLGWDGADTKLKLDFVAATLKDHMRWPDDPRDVDRWREEWASVFRHRIGYVIKTANALAERLAELARGIRDAAQTLMAHETEKGRLRSLHKAFQTALIHDLSEEDFADTYAQTITYGLLTAAISRTDMSAGQYGTALVAENVSDMVPITNPFLREMLQTFLQAGGRKGGIDFDELGIQDVVELLRGEETDLPAVLRDFGNRTQGEDPVINFYQGFLSAYNNKLRIQRGVFFTPKPAVSYIVRSVHELLQKEFGLEDGLASTVTWGEMARSNPEIKIPKGTLPDSPFVTILDPAVGTATFLVEVIDVVHKTMTAKWEKQGLNKAAQQAAWNEYVPKHLLPRLYGYELMMAPYAIAHMKIGLKLHETGYRFGSDERVRIYLTNSLEEPSSLAEQSAASLFEALGHEAQAVNNVKRKAKFTVVIGNPPYSGNSFNRGEWIENLINDYRKVDGKPLGEVKVWLKDDYVKFIRFSEYLLSLSGVGILGFITNNSFFDGLTFRGMRNHLLQGCSLGYFLNLHGNGNLKEKAPDGKLDENVFDIMQGVGISILLFQSSGLKRKFFGKDLFGKRDDKYRILNLHSVLQDNYYVLTPKSPNYFFVQKNEAGLAEYETFMPLPKLFRIGGLGFQSHRDNFVVSISRTELTKRIKEFFNLKVTDAEIKEKYEIDDYRRFVIRQYRRKNKFNPSTIIRIQYRPFDYRYIYYARDIVQEWQFNFHGHLLYQNNLGLNIMRQTKSPTWQHVMISNTPTPAVFVEIKDGSSQFPLYLYDEFKGTLFAAKNTISSVNIFESPITYWFSSMGASASWLEQARSANLITPDEVLYYAYAILHSPSYRQRYVEFLKIDFPRLPLTSNIELFRELCALGKELVGLHLLEFETRSNDFSRFVRGQRATEVATTIAKGYPKYAEGRVHVNESDYFAGVPNDVWEFHIGGYQVCHKWLKDRRGRQLSKEDIAHYKKIVNALGETIRLMGEVDAAIESAGGWPMK